MRVCGRTAGSRWVNALPPDREYVDLRAKWRVSWLRVMRWIAATGVLACGIGEGLIYRERIALPFDLPRWMPLAVAQYIAVVGVTFVAVRAVGWILTQVWQRWVRAEQDLILGQDTPQGTPWLSLSAMVSIPWLLFFAAWLHVHPRFTDRRP